MEQCYPFLDDFEICGVIDEQTEKEHLKITHVPTQQKTSIDCFHTVMGELGETDLTHHSDTIFDLEAKKAGVFGTVQFFSENGLDAFKIQQSIEENTQIMPWSQKILPFIAQHNHKALKLYIDHAIDACVFEGKPHDPCLLANLLPFKDIISDFIPTQKLWALPREITSVKIAEMPQAPLKLPDYAQFFTDQNKWVRYNAAANPNATKLPEYIQLFTDEDRLVREAAAANPNATKLPEYIQLFTDKDQRVREAVVKNINAPMLSVYARFFTDEDKWIRFDAAANPNAPTIPEYVQLFTDQDNRVRERAAQNINAPSLSAYIQLFTDEDDNIRYAAANNPNAPTLPAYAQLFTDKDWAIRRNAAMNPNAPKIPEYTRLFQDVWIQKIACRNETAKIQFPTEWQKFCTKGFK